jgi:hypothetical protein
MDERQLERMAKQLGARAEAKLDVELTAQAVLKRLREEPVRVAWWRRGPVLQGLAAAAVVVLTAGILVSNHVLDGGRTPAAVFAPVELQELSLEELEEVYDSVAVEAPVYELVAVGLHDLNESELEELLRLMEG